MADESLIEKVREVVHEPAPMQQIQNFGLGNGNLFKYLNGAAVTLMGAILISVLSWVGWLIVDQLRSARQDAHEDRKEQRDAAEKAHQQFHEQNVRQWEAVSKNTDAVKGMAEDVRRSNVETQAKLTTLIEEVKKTKGREQ